MPQIRRSKIWTHFVKISPITAKCKFCSKILKSCGNTTNMKKHLDVHAKRKEWIAENEDNATDTKEISIKECSVLESLDEWQSGPSTDLLEETVGDMCQTNGTVSSCPVQKNTLFQEIFIEKQDTSVDEDSRVTNAILYFICKDSAPFSLIAGEGFKYLMKQVAPFYKIPSQEALKRQFDEKFELASASYKARFSNVDHFTVSIETWTEKLSNRSFLNVTVHYLYRGSIKSIAIETVEITGRYSEEHIGPRLVEILSNWNIDYTKVLAVVTMENVTVTAAVHETFGFQKHLSCFMLGMNSIATKILCSEVLEELLEKARTIVRWVVGYDKNDDLRKRQISDGIESAKDLFLDDKMQWTSTFTMLERFSELYRFLNDMLMYEPEAPTIPMDDDLTAINQVLSLLRLVKHAIRECTDQSKVTISKIIPIVNCMKLKLSKFKHELEIVREVKNEMEQHLSRRFGFIEQNSLMAVATLLDPRFKHIHFSDPTAADSAKGIIRSLIRIDVQSGYNSEDGKESDGLDFWSPHNDLAYRAGVRDELSIYLAGSLSSLVSNPLEIWEDIKSACPRLFRQALKYLAVPTIVFPGGDFTGYDQRRCIELNHRMNKYFFLKSCPEEEWFA